jgi:hypothetical protein
MGSEKPQAHTTSIKIPKVFSYTVVRKKSEPLWKESTFKGLFSTTSWNALEKSEKRLVLQNRFNQGLCESLNSMLELNTHCTLGIRTKKILKDNVWLSSANNEPLLKAQPDQIDSNVLGLMKQMKDQILDARNWNAPQFMMVTPIIGKQNCLLQYDIENGITLHTTRKIQIAEPLYLGSLNVTKIAIQLQDDIQTIC